MESIRKPLKEEDIREIHHLKARYCNGADGGWDRGTHDADTVASLFIPEGVWDGGQYGRYEGRDAIHAYFKSCQRFPLAFHFVGNPIVAVNGDEATGQWHLLAALNIDGNKGILIGGIYNDAFVRTSEGWRFRQFRVTIAFTEEKEKEGVIGG
jgi:hypothetical protein